MKKLIFIFIIAFSAGFLTHALFFPDVLVNGFTDVKAIVVPNTSPTSAQDVNSTFLTKITYNGKRFSRHSLVVPTASYVLIENLSTDSRMWLVSNNPLLATPRGYSYTEQIDVRLDKPGTFVVQEKENPQEQIVITVK
jgi:hypothetical protein